ncbi:hypothetical protein MMC31_004156 [Peltigera leucophlebia]|nr:hypothetical protein [Peltigera leucophlebia]
MRNEYAEQALRLYKDRDSGGIRMEASVLRGQLKRKPIWTAFITHHVYSNRWMRKIDSRTIQLAELQRYVFKSDYDAELDPDEQNNLSFLNSSDAKEFWSTVLDLGHELE